MYGLMLTLFILCITYYVAIFIYCTLSILTVASDKPIRTVHIPWTHYISLLIVILTTITSAIYLFGAI